MRLIRDTNIDFMGKRRIAFLISLAIIVPGLVSMAVRGGSKLGVDFTGGVQVEVRLVPKAGAAQPAGLSIEPVRQAVAAAGYDNRNIQRAGGGEENDFLIHVQATAAGQAVTGDEANVGETTATRIVGALRQQLPGHDVVLRQVQSVGPRVGSELKGAAVQAVLLSMLLVMAYVAWRFEFRFGVTTIIATFHDVLFVLGLFSILGKEMTLTVVAAFLTLVGYSVNDTIVVFDRIREELKIKQRRETYESIFNGAINKTLGRTLLTGLTTLLVLASLFLYGGEVIHDFAWVLLVGILVGTYSSIFVAAPLVIEWQKRADAREAAKAGAGAVPSPAARRTTTSVG
jgi:preprotein translocase subunit SecF